MTNRLESGTDCDIPPNILHAPAASAPDLQRFLSGI
jgi:hypothetical protein